jgi:hypothetical protein
MHGQRCIRSRRLATFMIAAALLLVAGCSSSSAPNLFPAVLDTPAAREDKPLSPGGANRWRARQAVIKA